MSDRKKEIIVKTSIVISCAFLFLLFPGPLIYCWFLNETILRIVAYINLLLFFISGLIMTILIVVLGLNLKPVKADRIPLVCNNYEELLQRIQLALKKNQYQSHKPVLLNDQCSMLIFTRKKIWKMDCFIVIRVLELDDDIIDQANSQVTDFMIQYYGEKRITDWISAIVLVCVDRITPSFHKFVNSNMQQGIKNYRLITGFSLGCMTLYVAKQKDGYAIMKYKKLKKEFLKMLDIDITRNKSKTYQSTR